MPSQSEARRAAPSSLAAGVAAPLTLLVALLGVLAALAVARDLGLLLVLGRLVLLVASSLELCQCLLVLVDGVPVSPEGLRPQRIGRRPE